MNKSNSEIREYEESDKASVLALLSHLWKTDNEKIKLAFDWKYDNNPVFEQKYRYVATSGNQIVAFRGFYPNKLRYNNVNFNILSPSDMVVASDFRRQGLFRSITKFSIRDIENKSSIDFFANFSSNKFSSPGYLKMGWKEIDSCKHLYSRTFTGSLLGKISSRQFYKRLKSYFNFIDRKSISFYESYNSDFKLEVRRKVDLDTIKGINNLPDREGLRLVIDSKYLEWRFRNPLKNYFFILLKKGDSISSYAILEKKKNGNYFLLDFNYSDLSNLKLLFVNLSIKYNINMIKTWAFPIGYNDLVYCKFFSPNIIYKLNDRYKPLNFLIRPSVSDIKEDSWIIRGVDIRDPSIWNTLPAISDGK